jgi:hypothetical protein
VVAGVAAAAGLAEEFEAGVEAVGEIVHGERADPRGGQLDRQRQPVQGTSDVARPLQEAPVWGEVGVGGAGAVQEQLHRRTQGVAGAGLGDFQRRDDEDLLAVHSEPLAAGGQHPERGGGREQLLDEHRRRRQQVLAVVEDQQAGRGPRPAAQGGHQRGARLDIQADRVSGRSRHRLPIPEGGQICPPGILLGGDLVGQPGLADPARADEGDQPAGGEQSADRGELAVSTHQRGHPGGQRAARRRQRLASRGLDLPAQHLLLKLPQRLRGVQAEIVAQPVAVAPVGGQRVDGAPRPGQGGDQQLDRSLVPRFLRDQGVEGGRGLGDPVQVQQQGRAVFPCCQPELLEPKGFRACERVGELGERRPAPQRQCLIQER